MAVPEGFTLKQSSVPPGFQLKPPPDAPEEQRLSFAQRFGKDLFDRSKMLEEILTVTHEGEQSTAEGVLQVAGKFGAGIVLDMLGEGLVSGVRGLSAITPDIIENPIKDAATSAAHSFLNTDIGRAGLEAASAGMERWEEFKEEHPRAARNIESVVNISLIVAPVKKGAAPTPGRLASKADDLTTAATAQEQRTALEFVDDLVRPAESKRVRIEQVPRTAEEGLLKQKVAALSPQEQRMSDAVSTVLEVSPKNTLQANYRAIDDAVSVEATQLSESLKNTGALIPRRESKNALKLAQMRLDQSPAMVGDAAKSANRIIEKANTLIDSNPGTSFGVLKTRRELDAWIRTQKPNAFDPATENAMSLAVKEVRQSLNNLIDARNPSQAVRESLSKQSNLLGAMDNIAEKAAAEGRNVITRTWKNISRILPIRGEFNQSMAVLMGVGGLGAAAAFAPYFTQLAGLGVGSYVAGKFLMSPQAKKGLATLLKKADEALGVATDPNMISQLRLDRAAIVEILENAEE